MDVACAVHVHSVYSDGTGTIEEIALAAAAAGAGVVLVTDHDTLEARRRGLEGWHHGVLVLVGVEVSSADGHLLAFGIETEINHAGLPAAQLAARVAQTGGLSFAAHPFSQGSRISTRFGRPHPWGALSAPDLTGIELWSLETDELEAARSPRELWRFLRAPEDVLGPPCNHLARWDELSAQRPVVGIAGLDAHQKGVRIRGRAFGLIGYERIFGVLRTHVLLDGPLPTEICAAREAVYAALGDGRCYLSLDALAPADGFSFWALDHRGDRVEMGATATGVVSLHVRAPHEARLRLLRNGEEVASSEGARLDCAVATSGAHRVEAHLDGKTWIVSNPVYVR